MDVDVPQECDDTYFGGGVAIVLVVVLVLVKQRLSRLRLEHDVRRSQRNSTDSCCQEACSRVLCIFEQRHPRIFLTNRLELCAAGLATQIVRCGLPKKSLCVTAAGHAAS
jgi:hypothetical protein